MDIRRIGTDSRLHKPKDRVHAHPFLHAVADRLARIVSNQSVPLSRKIQVHVTSTRSLVLGCFLIEICNLYVWITRNIRSKVE